MQSDITYIKDGLFTTFVSTSSAGDSLMSEMLAQNDGSPKVLTVHADSVIAQMRAKGYTVRKAKPATADEIAALYSELEELGL